MSPARAFVVVASVIVVAGACNPFAVTIGSGPGPSSGSGGATCSTVVDFETIPGGAPADGLSINTQLQVTNGVSFGLDKDLDGKPDPGASPVLAQVGDPATAFQYDQGGVGDTAAPGQKLGMFFLTDDGVISGPPAPLIITYASPVDAAYGQIIDIDGQEGWTLDARDAKDVVLDSVALNTGASVGGVGLAFDNFSPACDTPALK
jgi:hypothetical protein